MHLEGVSPSLSDAYRLPIIVSTALATLVLELTHRDLVQEDGTNFGELEIPGYMDTVARVLVVLALLAYSVFRLIRYFRYGTARRVTAVPPSTLGVLPTNETSAVVPATRSARILAGGTTILVFATANAILWVTLFRLPAFDQVPVMLRLFAGIFANFYLLPFARAAGNKQLKRMQANSVESSGNPFGG